MNTEEHVYKIKIILSLNKLLDKGKNLQKELKDNKIVYSYHGIASNALLRKSTVNDTLNGNTIPKATTLISIVEGMGFTMTDFSREFDNISEKEINKYSKDYN